ncbi:MAG: undecaprenyl-phosphate glucose phosphotransferase [Herbinix sp.]|jgi:exopolysaccharide biosynthesis polyprenyl glycosylphosphotransferase|nr:undecaprenyl-phosphate glucose phosphotransferase [Herbinix sp.]
MGKFYRHVKTNFYYMVSDFLVGIVAALLTGIITGIDIFADYGHYFVLCISFNVLCILLNKGGSLYNINLFFYPDRIIKYITKSILFATVIVSILLFYVGRANIEPKFYLEFLVSEYVLLMLSALFQRVIVKNNIKSSPRTLLLGDIKKYDRFINYVKKSNLNLNIVGYVALDGEGEQEGNLGNIEDLEKILHDNGIDYVYIMDQRSNTMDFNPHIGVCLDMGVTVGLIMDFNYPIEAHSYIGSMGNYPVVTYHTVVLNSVSRAIKRSMDIIGSIVGIIGFSPFMLLAAIAIKIEDAKGPIIFKQLRIGRNGRQFYIYKFRSMSANAEDKKKDLMSLNEMNDGFMFKIKDDPRITKVGKFLRKNNIDELPQFFNVLKGDMSLVGTRPPTLDEVEKYKRHYWRRVSIKPGLTGMWQVSGRSKITNFEKVVELDTIYIDKWDILLDFKIIFKTVIKLISKNDDAY